MMDKKSLLKIKNEELHALISDACCQEQEYLVLLVWYQLVP